VTNKFNTTSKQFNEIIIVNSNFGLNGILSTEAD